MPITTIWHCLSVALLFKHLPSMLVLACWSLYTHFTYVSRIHCKASFLIDFWHYHHRLQSLHWATIHAHVHIRTVTVSHTHTHMHTIFNQWGWVCCMCCVWQDALNCSTQRNACSHIAGVHVQFGFTSHDCTRTLKPSFTSEVDLVVCAACAKMLWIAAHDAMCVYILLASTFN